MLWPLTGWYFISLLFIQKWFSYSYLYYTIPLIVLNYLIFLIVLEKNKPPKFHMLFTLQALLSSAALIYIFAGVYMDMINSVSIL